MGNPHDDEAQKKARNACPNIRHVYWKRLESKYVPEQFRKFSGPTAQFNAGKQAFWNSLETSKKNQYAVSVTIPAEPGCYGTWSVYGTRSCHPEVFWTWKCVLSKSPASKKRTGIWRKNAQQQPMHNTDFSSHNLTQELKMEAIRKLLFLSSNFGHCREGGWKRSPIKTGTPPRQEEDTGR